MHAAALLHVPLWVAVALVLHLNVLSIVPPLPLLLVRQHLQVYVCDKSGIKLP